MVHDDQYKAITWCSVPFVLATSGISKSNGCRSSIEEYNSKQISKEREGICRLSPFLIGRTFVSEHSWEYSANIVGS